MKPEIVRDVPILTIGPKFPAVEADEVINSLGELDYQPALALGPAVDGQPAWGLVKALRRSAGKLLADFEVGHPAIAAALRNRTFKSVVTEIYQRLQRRSRQVGRALRVVRLEGLTPPSVPALVPAGVIKLDEHFAETRVYSEGGNGEPASERLDRMIKERMREKNISYEAAWNEILGGDKALAQEYEAEVSAKARIGHARPTGHASDYSQRPHDAGVEVDEKAKARLRDHKSKTYDEACDHVLAEDRELAERYHQESVR